MLLASLELVEHGVEALEVLLPELAILLQRVGGFRQRRPRFPT